MVEEVTSKNTKSEIIEAYEKLLKEIKQTRKVSPKEESEIRKQQEIVQKSTKNTPDDIIKNITDLKLKITKLFDEIGDKITDECKRLYEIQQAIDIESKNLQEKYAINTNADTLDALLFAQKQKSEEFERDMQQKRQIFDEEISTKRLAWQKEQKELELDKKEQEQQLVKIRKREEDEYNYKLAIERQKTSNNYEMEKAALERELKERREVIEKEFAEREVILTNQEQELQELREKITKLPEVLEKATKDAEQKTIQRLQMEHKFTTDLQNKEVEGERKLGKQIITALETKIKEMEAHISNLTQKANQAAQRVHDIAVKTIESTSGLKRNSEKGSNYQVEQAAKES